jgi:hypothetical protein
MTHDYKRNGTTTLFAALNTLDGSVVGECLPRHRHQEFLKLLRTLDREFPAELDLHLIVDNYRTHKHDNVNQWLARHPRFQLHFTPTSSQAEPRRTVLRQADRQSNPPRRLLQRPRPDRRDPRLPRRPQRGPQAIRLDRVDRLDPRKRSDAVKPFLETVH